MEKYYWFDDGLEHSSSELAEFFAGALSTGVNVYGNPNALLVEKTTGMGIKVNSGIAYIEGRYYNSGGDLSFVLTSYAGSIKHVRVVVKVDESAKQITTVIKEGSSPPSLTRDNSTFEISLASIVIPAGASSLSAVTITDERSNSEVCGFFRFAGHEASRVPAGIVEFFAGSTPPPGWLECDGANVSRSVYSDLFNAIGTTYGSGDGSTTFTLPDLRAEFIRGWDNGRGIDVDRQFGSFQDGTAFTQSNYYMAYTSDADADGTAEGTRTGVGGTYTFTKYRTRPRNIALLSIIKT